jgi:hypothetical protein
MARISTTRKKYANVSYRFRGQRLRVVDEIIGNRTISETHARQNLKLNKGHLSEYATFPSAQLAHDAMVVAIVDDEHASVIEASKINRLSAKDLRKRYEHTEQYKKWIEATKV